MHSRKKQKGRGFQREVVAEVTSSLVGMMRVLGFPMKIDLEHRSSRFLDRLMHLNFHLNQIVDYSHFEGTLVIVKLNRWVGIDLSSC